MNDIQEIARDTEKVYEVQIKVIVVYARVDEKNRLQNYNFKRKLVNKILSSTPFRFTINRHPQLAKFCSDLLYSRISETDIKFPETLSKQGISGKKE